MRRRVGVGVGGFALVVSVTVVLCFGVAAAGSAHDGSRRVSAGWERLAFPPPDPFAALAVDPHGANTVYVGLGLRGVYKTTDGGRGWDYVGLRGTKRVWSLAVHPTVPGVVHAGVMWKSGTGVATSHDAGRRWSAPVECCGVEVMAWAFDPRDRRVVYAGGDGVSKSRDGGRTWMRPETTEVIRGSHVNGLAVVTGAPQTLYAAVGGGGAGPTTSGVFRSTDAGKSWRRTGLERWVVDVAVEQRQPRIVYAAASRRLFKSENAGRTWQPVTRGLPSWPLRPGAPCYLTSLVLDPFRAQTIYVGTSCGVYRSTDGARTWRAFSEGLGNAAAGLSVTDLAIGLDPAVLYAMTHAGLARRPLQATS